ncbi:MAG: ABC transporter ATP-binding protein [Proteobacteria bacterium]|nr:ABC transporter ATP-binding protein [Pseudomonadota bacterium]MBU1582579.1 ABC transporter ATP-binding protein [Pseudomonadota bacterium]MBU2452254.1 ABC transporter ATP-binding protein [Pseudomonadota bacterium]MBU2630216.1 ABC transporter ATP-binding protein [Pseudomonadota bacterium]
MGNVTGSAAIKIRALQKTFSNGWGKRSVIIKNLNLDIMDNEIFGYLGANGAGKTTTFKLMLGLIFPDKGDVFFWEKPAADYKNRSFIGYLPENPYFYSYLTAEESLDFYASLFDMNTTVKKQRVAEMLHLVGLNHAKDLQLRKFSRGMLQRIGIAQAMINDPKLLILDEPMSGLDPMGRKDMRDIILNCRDQGKTVIFSSHIISDVELICDRASILSKGELKQVVEMDDRQNTEDSIWEIICQGNALDISTIKEYGKIKHLVTGNRNIFSTTDKGLANRMMDEIKNQGLDLISFGSRRKNIEDIYIKSVNVEGKNHG